MNAPFTSNIDTVLARDFSAWKKEWFSTKPYGVVLKLTVLSEFVWGIVSIPDSIGQLTHLTNSIGQLTHLAHLELDLKNKIIIGSLPPTIGRLQNLNCLRVYNSSWLTTLPNEIGNLVGLKALNITLTGITSIPSSIGRLQNLEHLWLGENTKLRNLPDEVGDLSSLQSLHLGGSGITSLPGSIYGLKGLVLFCLDGTSIPELRGNHANDFLFTLARQFPLLGIVGHRFEMFNTKLSLALASNIARFHMGFLKELESTQKERLWPHFLRCARVAFDQYPLSDRTVGRLKLIQHPDAIFRLLTDGRESFVVHLIHRNKRIRLFRQKWPILGAIQRC